MANQPSTVLEQFAGATIERIGLTRDGRFPSSLAMTLRLKDGSDRTLEIYTLEDTESVLHVRVDGQFVPPEELP